jgi:two-component system, LytTR family, sensor kinase
MGELLNLIGLSTGVVLYAMLLVMVVRGGSAPTARVDPLLVATALLGLVWNLCALPAYELPKLGIPGPFPLLTVVGFSALGFLPAVVVQSVLRGDANDARRWPKRVIAVFAYAVSAIATILHLRAGWIGEPLPSSIAMRLLTYAFIGLVIPLALATRGQSGSRRTLWAAALSIFAVSALHLSQFHEGDDSWPVELVGHHASVPLALAILYQDFPFALADLFLKRALTLLALVAAPFTAVAVLRAALMPEAGTLRNVRDVGLLATMWVATALLYPRLRGAVEWFVDAILLDRPDYDALLTDITRESQRHDEVESVLDDACAQLAPALSARVVRWSTLESAAEAPSDDRVAAKEPPRASSYQADAARVAATVEIPVFEPPRYAIEVADLTGGRRLLSDDHAALTAIAARLGHRIDAIRLTHERYERQLREQEISKLATEAELRALRAQINPHFLFNALTTIGYLIQTSPGRALETLLRLTSLLRAVLRSETEFTTLGREIDLVESYLDIERARFEDRLRVRLDVPVALKSLRVPPLFLQPLVENAVKHGIAPERRGGEVVVTARLERDGHDGLVLVLTVHDSGAGASPESLKRGREVGVGLTNIERRLMCYYGQAATLSIVSAPGAGTTVEIHMPAEFKMAAELTSSRSAP